MGSFFTNLHVAANIGEVSTAIDAAMAKDGLKRCGDGDVMTRELVLIPSGRWLAVFDSASESQGGEHAELASKLSHATKRPATAFLVHDSDVFEAQLFDGGKLIDKYVNRPDYFEDVGDDESEALAGQPNAWRDVAGADALRIGAVFAANEEVFCEEQTAALAEALGMSSELATCGYNYFGGVEGEAAASALRLQYCEKNPPKRASGPPRLELSESTKMTIQMMGQASQLAPLGVLTAGSPLQCGGPSTFHLELENHGGAHRGVKVSVFGAGLSNPLVELTGARLLAGEEHHALKLTTEGSRRVAELPDVVLHEAGWRHPGQPLGRFNLPRPAVQLWLSFFVEAPCKIPLSVTVEPLGGGGGSTTEVVLEAGPWIAGEGQLRQRFMWSDAPPSLDAVAHQVELRSTSGISQAIYKDEGQLLLAPDLHLLRVRDLIILDVPHSDRATQSGALASIRGVLTALGGQQGAEERGQPSALAAAGDLMALAQKMAAQLSDAQRAQVEGLVSGLTGGLGEAMSGVMESLGFKKKAAPKPKPKAKPKPKVKAKLKAKAKAAKPKSKPKKAAPRSTRRKR